MARYIVLNDELIGGGALGGGNVRQRIPITPVSIDFEKKVLDAVQKVEDAQMLFYAACSASYAYAVASGDSLADGVSRRQPVIRVVHDLNNPFYTAADTLAKEAESLSQQATTLADKYKVAITDAVIELVALMGQWYGWLQKNRHTADYIVYIAKFKTYHKSFCRRFPLYKANVGETIVV